MSDKNDQLRKEIAGLINSIKEHSDSIGDKPEIHHLELEVILQKIKKLYEKSIIFNHLISTPAEVNEPLPVVAVKVEPIVEIPKQEKKVVEEPKKKTEAVDLFSMDDEHSMKSSEKSEPNLSEKFQHTKIENLKSAIGINEKFRFVNELFEGNTNEYHAAIDQLNTFNDVDEANIYINSLQDIYQWNMDNQVIRNFLDLVKRRFI